MSDAPIRPAMPVLPSRAAGEAPLPLAPTPATPTAPHPEGSVRGAAQRKAAAGKARRAAKRKAPAKAKAKRPAAKKRAKPLPAAEVRALNAKRARALRAKKKRTAAQIVQDATANTPPIPAVLQVPAKRGPGRPRKDPNAPPRPRGRPAGAKGNRLKIILAAHSAMLAALGGLTPAERRDMLALLRS